MVKIRLILFSLMMVVAAGAVATSSASAHEFLILGKKIEHGTKLLFLSKQTTSAVLNGPGLQITCTTVKNHGFLEALGKTTATVTFTVCTVNTPASCTVAEPIVVKATDQLTLFEGKLSDKFTPEAPPTFAVLKFAGAECPLTTLEVNGTATGTVDNETEALAHILTFSATSGSELTVGGGAAIFKLKDEIWLENDDKWKAE